MGIYEDRLIYIKTGSRPIKSQGNWSSPGTNRTPYNNNGYRSVIFLTGTKDPPW